MRHVERDTDKAFAINSKGIEFIDSLNVKKSDTIVEKNKISPFYKTNLAKELKGIKQIVICGILTNLCVRSLAEDAYDRDFQITIIKDCCKAFDVKMHEFTLKDLKVTREEIEFLNLNEFVKTKCF